MDTKGIHALGVQIAAELGDGWRSEIDDAAARGGVRLKHTDGREIEADLIEDGARIWLHGLYPATDDSIRGKERVTATAAATRPARAIAQQIKREAFMGVYTKTLARVQAHNARNERIAENKKRRHEMLTAFLPADLDRSSAQRPTIEHTRAHRYSSERGWQYTEEILTRLEFRELNEDEARLMMRAYAIVKGFDLPA